MKSFVSKSVFDRLLPRPVLGQNTHNCVSITGQPLDIAGITQLEMSFPGSSSCSYTGTFLVSATLFQPLECVLGWDFITSNALQLSSAGDGTYFLLGKHGSTPLSPYEPTGSTPSPIGSESLDAPTSDDRSR
ncbi:MAG: hypothetical protein AAFN81_35530, partial [Bacteroidota bacterium]